MEFGGRRSGRRASVVLLLSLGVALSGCVTAKQQAAPESNLTARDRQLLAKASYAQARIPQPYLRHIVDYHRKEAPGTILVDSALADRLHSSDEFEVRSIRNLRVKDFHRLRPSVLRAARS